MLLFLISFLLIFTSSYVLTSILKPRENSIGFIYLFLIAFAQIILTLELLSLFSAINQSLFLALNGVFSGGILLFWNNYQRPVWKLTSNNLLKRTINSLKLDKSLGVLAVGFSVFIIAAVFLCIVMPVDNADALSYHISRCLFWISQGNLNHFVTADIRNTCLPINSELLYTWVLLFVRRDAGIGFFGFVGYIFSIVAVFNILGLLGFCVRKRLWVIFILTSLPSVLVQASTTETDIIISALVSSSIFLFWNGLKNNNKIPIYMASLAYAIAVGVKPTAIMMIPAVGLLLMLLSVRFKNYKLLSCFLICTCVNFLIFSSYNYILNYFDFGNFIGAESFIAINKNYFGIKGAFSNFIKHFYMFIDFTGFRWGLYLHPYLETSKIWVLSLFGAQSLPDSYYTVNSFKDTIILFEPSMGAGIIGFLLYIPCVILSLFKITPIFKRQFFLAFFGIGFIVNLFILSCLMNYSSFDVRYVVAFIVVSSPVLVYSYGIKFKPFKYLVMLFALYSLIFISTNIKARPLFRVIDILNKSHSIVTLRKESTCKNDPCCILRYKVKLDFAPGNKILVLLSKSENIYFVKLLQLEGYDVDFGLLEDSDKIDFNKYNLLITEDNKQISYFQKMTFVKNKDIFCKYEVPTTYIPTVSYVDCKIKEHFFTENNFISYFVLSVKKNPEYLQNQEDKDYFIYENRNNPPVKKLHDTNK